MSLHDEKHGMAAVIRECAIIVAYILLVLIFTWPLAARFTSALPGAPGDNYREIWRANCQYEELRSGHLILGHSPSAFYPLGADYPIDGTPFIVLIALLAPRIGLVAAFNALVILQIAFSGYACYRLAFYLWKDRRAALFSGMIFALAPYLIRKTLGHNAMDAACFLPLAFLFVMKALDDGRFRWSAALWAGLFCGLNAGANPYYMLILAVWLAGLFIYQWQAKRRAGLIPLYAVVGVVSLIVMAPQMASRLAAAQHAAALGVVTLGHWFHTAIDLTGVLIPPATHPLWGSVFAPFGLENVERTSFIGLTVLILAYIGWKEHRASPWIRWTVIWMVGGFLLSLGPVLKVFGRIGFLPLPDLLLWLVPPFNATTSVAGWAILTTLGAALLAGGGARRITVRFPNRKWILPALSAAILVEYLSMPIPVTPLERLPREVKSALRAGPGPMLCFPLGGCDALDLVGQFNSRAMWLQCEAGLPIIGGHVQRMSPEQRDLLSEPLASEIIAVQAAITPPAPPSAMISPTLRMRRLLKRFDEHSPLIARAVKWFTGEQKYRQIMAYSEVPPPPAPRQSMLPPAGVIGELQRLGLTYVLALDPDRPAVAAGLDYLRQGVALDLVWQNDRTAIYRINMNAPHL